MQKIWHARSSNGSWPHNHITRSWPLPWPIYNNHIMKRWHLDQHQHSSIVCHKLKRNRLQDMMAAKRKASVVRSLLLPLASASTPSSVARARRRTPRAPPWSTRPAGAPRRRPAASPTSSTCLPSSPRSVRRCFNSICCPRLVGRMPSRNPWTSMAAAPATRRSIYILPNAARTATRHALTTATWTAPT
uniref:Pollen-specific protein n=1 Tax=Triticum aestivum TaxID=4565 RepID=Q6SSD7_WHEAT|nr:pollen-specific protein [Triticum aestivum]ACL50975.1 pollen-specific protein [Triticum aestivum]